MTICLRWPEALGILTHGAAKSRNLSKTQMKQLIKLWFIRRYLRQPNLTYASVPIFDARPWPRFKTHGSLSLGADCLFRTQGYRSYLEVRQGGSMEIGKKCYFNSGVDICATLRITIGDHTGLSNGVTVFDTHFHPVEPGDEVLRAPVTIGRNVWIGRHSLVMPGSVIGDHSVIGAHSVVNGIIPPKVVAMGYPARPIKMIKCPDDWIRP